MNISLINWLAVLVAAASAFGLGGLWYGPVFGKAWQTLSGLSDEDIQQGHPGKIYGGALALNLVIAATLALLLQLHPAPDLLTGLNIGALLGVALVATNLGINYLFSRRPMKLYLIDAGYMVCLMVIMGAILGGWR